MRVLIVSIILITLSTSSSFGQVIYFAYDVNGNNTLYTKVNALPAITASVDTIFVSSLDKVYGFHVDVLGKQTMNWGISSELSWVELEKKLFTKSDSVFFWINPTELRSPGRTKLTIASAEAKNSPLFVIVIVEDDLITGIEETPHTINVYPNPSKGLLRVSSSDNSKQPLAVTVVDAQGRLVFEGSSVNEAVDLSNLANGVYILSLVELNGQSQRFRVVLLK